MLDGQGLARVAKRKKTERSNFDEYERGINILILILLEKTNITIFHIEFHAYSSKLVEKMRNL